LEGGEIVKKTAVTILVLALLLLFAAAPAMAEPTNGQKIPAIMTFPVPPKITMLDPGEVWKTPGNVSHRRDTIVNYTFVFTIGDDPPLTGYAITVRDGNGIIPKTGMFSYHEYYEFWFPTVGGGFEGRGLSHYFDFVSMSSYDLEIHVVLHGTGSFEGQTLNMWRTGGVVGPGWTGYLLKP